ncbi:MAG: choice-of-anchor Q domain-containing protein, partial [Dehalococcoidia bacterium]
TGSGSAAPAATRSEPVANRAAAIVPIANITCPSVTAVSPNSGPVTGGQQVTISGCGLQPNNTTVFFGPSNPADPKTTSCRASFSGAVQCTVIVPPAKSGLVVDVQVQIGGPNGQMSAANPPADQYTYVEPVLATAGGIVAFGQPTSTKLTNVTISGNKVSAGPNARALGANIQACTPATPPNPAPSPSATPDPCATPSPTIGPTPSPVPGFVLKNTVIANPIGGDNCLGHVVGGYLDSQGSNLSSDASCGFSAPGDKPSVDPLLGPLQDNGGAAQTQAIPSTSPAKDAVAAAACPPPATDERGLSRPQGAACDIGAFELQQLAGSGPVSPIHSSVLAGPGTVVANGSSSAMVTVTLTDAGGNPVGGKSVILLPVPGISHAAIAPPSGTSNGAGVVSFSVRDTVAEAQSFMAVDTTDSLTLAQTTSATFVQPGDVNGDQTLSAVDALCVLRSVAGLALTSNCSKRPAAPNDPLWHVSNTEGPINAVDALCILRAVAQLAATQVCPSLTSGQAAATVPAGRR